MAVGGGSVAIGSQAWTRVSLMARPCAVRFGTFLRKYLFFFDFVENFPTAILPPAANGPTLDPTKGVCLPDDRLIARKVTASWT